MDKVYTTLELDKVLLRLANEAHCEDTRSLALNLEPATSFSETKRLMRYTNDAYVLSMRYGSPTIFGVKNITQAVKRADIGAVLTPRELLNIAEVLRNIRALCQWREYSKDEPTVLDDYFGQLSPNKYLEDKITGSILSEDEIADSASPALAEIRRKMRHCSQEARNQLEKMVRSPAYQKFLQENIITMRDSRFVVPVKTEFKNEVQGLVHDTSSSGATLFIEPAAVVELNNELKILQSKEKAEIERILTELSAETGTFAQSITDSYTALISLDLLFSKANLGISMRACVPEISDDGVIELKKARHPLIDPKVVVPVDISLGEKFDTLVITGPNTGGKTVALKTLGLFSLMTMCGLMIPCDDTSRISVFDKVLADIGDEQSIEQSLSTFSSHIKRIIEILKVADEHSLVLLDELASGTDPAEGAALAIAILEDLRRKKAKIAATTHYSEIKMYALETEGVENGCCEFDVSTLKPTYKLLIGIPGRSNAFAISKRLGIDESIIERAKDLLSTEDTRFESVVSSLEETRLELARQQESARRDAARASQEKVQAEAFKKQLEAEKEKEIQKARETAENIVRDTKLQAEKLIRELEAALKDKNSERFSEMASKAKAEIKSRYAKLDALADPVTKKNTEPYVLPRKLKKGDNVLIVDIDKKGVVLADPKGDTVQVQAGIIKTTVKLSNLKLLKDQNTSTVSSSTYTGQVKSKITNDFKSELDIRGMNLEEAYAALDKFLDDCMIASLPQARIIHGKGTGVLRSGVQEYLRRHKGIRSFRLGVYGEGESGVTIVEFK